jgi:hypothetical protein
VVGEALAGEAESRAGHAGRNPRFIAALLMTTVQARLRTRASVYWK